jgi:hypothetical protein
VSWFREHLGMDGISFLIHAGITAALMTAVAVSGGPREVQPMILGGSLAVRGIHRFFVLRKRGPAGLTTGEMSAEQRALGRTEAR